MANKPLPDHIKLLKGTARKDRLNPQAPKFEVDEIQCPPHFKGKHREVWMDIVPKLIKAGVATNIDSYALEALCEKWCEFREAQTKLNDNGTVILTPSGFPQLSPYYSISKQALNDFGKLMTEFGMTASSRTKIKAGDEGKGKRKGRFDGV
tara:strand:- start:1247 stop:1699 length:453 start_codon:yes stop_codon:yes gene_type:complete